MYEVLSTLRRAVGKFGSVLPPLRYSCTGPCRTQTCRPGQDQTAPADDRRQPEVTRPVPKRRGIAAQFDAIAAGQKPQGSCLTYWYGFFQLLYHKSFGLFARTYLSPNDTVRK